MRENKKDSKDEHKFLFIQENEDEKKKLQLKIIENQKLFDDYNTEFNKIIDKSTINLAKTKTHLKERRPASASSYSFNRPLKKITITQKNRPLCLPKEKKERVPDFTITKTTITAPQPIGAQIHGSFPRTSTKKATPTK